MEKPIIYRVTTGGLSPYTKASYQMHINDFLAFYKITDIEVVKDWSPRLARQHLIDYVIHLRDVKRFPRSSIKVHVAAVTHFLYMTRDDATRLDMTKVRMELPPDEFMHRDRPYTVEEIQRMLSACSRTRERMIVLLLTSTGVRIGAIHTLKVGDLVNRIVKVSGIKSAFQFKGEAKGGLGFRKFYKTQAEESGMKSIHVEVAHGHSIGVSGHYYRPKPSDILQDYITHAADALTIDPTQRLKQENAELRKAQSDYLAELGDLRHDFNEMKQLIVHLSKENQKQLVDEFFQKVGDKADIEWSCD
jgi:integrase